MCVRVCVCVCVRHVDLRVSLVTEAGGPGHMYTGVCVCVRVCVCVCVRALLTCVSLSLQKREGQAAHGITLRYKQQITDYEAQIHAYKVRACVCV